MFQWKRRNNNKRNILCNVLQRTGSDFCGTNNLQGIFAHFHFRIFIQEAISTYGDSMPEKFSIVRCLTNAVVNVPRNCWELWKQLISSNFQNGTFEIINITVRKIVLIQVFLLPMLLNKKNKSKKTEYHGTFTPFKNQGDSFFCCFGHGA